MALYETFKKLLAAAEQFEAKAPQYRRIEREQQALREAITSAQLALSVADAKGTGAQASRAE
jgi:hypothetical protein